MYIKRNEGGVVHYVLSAERGRIDEAIGFLYYDARDDDVCAYIFARVLYTFIMQWCMRSAVRKMTLRAFFFISSKKNNVSSKGMMCIL